MRLWTLHPRYLDPQGLTALWRESLLARAVLQGLTRGYRQHPQLQRFQAHAQPLAAVDRYLHEVHAESLARGYRYDAGKLGRLHEGVQLPASTGQLALEWQHLLAKLQARSPERYRQWRDLGTPDCHPMFTVVPGPVAPWERATVVDAIPARPAAKRRPAR
jgi:hypothetical protein